MKDDDDDDVLFVATEEHSKEKTDFYKKNLRQFFSPAVKNKTKKLMGKALALRRKQEALHVPVILNDDEDLKDFKQEDVAGPSKPSVRLKTKRKKLKSEKEKVELAIVSDPSHDENSMSEKRDEASSSNLGSEKKCCNICNQEVLLISFRDHLLHCMKTRFGCLKKGSEDEAAPVEKIDCPICGKDLQLFGLQSRSEHINKCIDKADDKDKSDEEYNKLLENARTAVMSCPMCGKKLQTVDSRKRHIKQCALSNNMSVEQVRNLIGQQAEEYHNQLDAGILPQDFRPPAKDTKAKGTKKTLKLGGDVELAVALSTSMAEFQAHGDNLGKNINQKVKPQTGKKSKQNESNNLLLTLTKDEAKERISSKVAAYIFSGSPEEDLSKTPSFKKKKIPDVTHSESLWSKTSLAISTKVSSSSSPTTSMSTSLPISSSSSLLPFYVDALMPVVSVSTVVPGSKLRRCSQIPGRGKSFGPTDVGVNEPTCQEDNEPSEDANLSSPLIESTTFPSGCISSPLTISQKTNTSQTVAILAQLAEENEIENDVTLKELTYSQYDIDDIDITTPGPHKSKDIPEDDSKKDPVVLDSLSSDFLTLVDNPSYSDVTINVRGTEIIAAHMNVLSVRCPQLLQKVEKCGQGKEGYHLDLTDFSKDSVLCILKYIYGGRIDIKSVKNSTEVTELAERFSLRFLSSSMKRPLNAVHTRMEISLLHDVDDEMEVEPMLELDQEKNESDCGSDQENKNESDKVLDDENEENSDSADHSLEIIEDIQQTPEVYNVSDDNEDLPVCELTPETVVVEKEKKEICAVDKRNDENVNSEFDDFPCSQISIVTSESEAIFCKTRIDENNIESAADVLLCEGFARIDCDTLSKENKAQDGSDISEKHTSNENLEGEATSSVLPCEKFTHVECNKSTVENEDQDLNASNGIRSELLTNITMFETLEREKAENSERKKTDLVDNETGDPNEGNLSVLRTDLKNQAIIPRTPSPLDSESNVIPLVSSTNTKLSENNIIPAVSVINTNLSESNVIPLVSLTNTELSENNIIPAVSVINTNLSESNVIPLVSLTNTELSENNIIPAVSVINNNLSESNVIPLVSLTNTELSENNIIPAVSVINTNLSESNVIPLVSLTNTELSENNIIPAVSVTNTNLSESNLVSLTNTELSESNIIPSVSTTTSTSITPRKKGKKVTGKEFKEIIHKISHSGYLEDEDVNRIRIKMEQLDNQCGQKDLNDSVFIPSILEDYSSLDPDEIKVTHEFIASKKCKKRKRTSTSLTAKTPSKKQKLGSSSHQIETPNSLTNNKSFPNSDNDVPLNVMLDSPYSKNSNVPPLNKYNDQSTGTMNSVNRVSSTLDRPAEAQGMVNPPDSLTTEPQTDTSIVLFDSDHDLFSSDDDEPSDLIHKVDSREKFVNSLWQNEKDESSLLNRSNLPNLLQGKNVDSEKEKSSFSTSNKESLKQSLVDAVMSVFSDKKGSLEKDCNENASNSGNKADKFPHSFSSFTVTPNKKDAEILRSQPQITPQRYEKIQQPPIADITGDKNYEVDLTREVSSVSKNIPTHEHNMKKQLPRQQNSNFVGRVTPISMDAFTEGMMTCLTQRIVESKQASHSPHIGNTSLTSLPVSSTSKQTPVWSYQPHISLSSSEPTSTKVSSHKTSYPSPLPLRQRLGCVKPFDAKAPRKNSVTEKVTHEEGTKTSLQSEKKLSEVEAIEDLLAMEGFDDFDSPELVMSMSETPEGRKTDNDPDKAVKGNNPSSITPVSPFKNVHILDLKSLNENTPECNRRVKNLKKSGKGNVPSPFTPMPAYKDMNTPDLKKAVQKIGVKPIGKKRMRDLLTHVYQETHQYETDSDYEATPVKRNDQQGLKSKGVAVTKAFENRNYRDTGSSSSCSDFSTVDKAKNRSGKDKGSKKAVPFPSTSSASGLTDSTGEKDDEDDIVSSQDSSFSDGPVVLEESIQEWPEEEDAPCTQLTQTSMEVVSDRLMNFLRGNPKIYEQILMYEPLELDVLKKQISDAGIRIGMERLQNFLDERCITFSMKNMNNRNNRQQQGRKKTTKNSPHKRKQISRADKPK